MHIEVARGWGVAPCCHVEEIHRPLFGVLVLQSVSVVQSYWDVISLIGCIIIGRPGFSPGWSSDRWFSLAWWRHQVMAAAVSAETCHE